LESFLILNRLGFVLGGALGLDLAGFEDSVGPQSAVSESLRAALERVRQRVHAAVDDLQLQRVLMKHKRNFTAVAGDRAVFDIASYAYALCHGALPHLVQLGNGLVIRLAFIDPAGGEQRQDANNRYHEGTELRVGFHTLSRNYQYTLSAPIPTEHCGLWRLRLIRVHPMGHGAPCRRGRHAAAIVGSTIP